MAELRDGFDELPLHPELELASEEEIRSLARMACDLRTDQYRKFDGTVLNYQEAMAPEFICRRYEIGDTIVTGIVKSLKQTYPEAVLYTDRRIDKPFKDLRSNDLQLVQSTRYDLHNRNIRHTKPDYVARVSPAIFRVIRSDGMFGGLEGGRPTKADRGHLKAQDKKEFKELDKKMNTPELRRKVWHELCELLDAASAVGRPVDLARSQGHDYGG